MSKFIKFATFGITSEVVFTALYDVIVAYSNGTDIDWNLKGFTYIWMIPLYGLVALLAPIVIDRTQHIPILIRLLLYSMVIFFVEYTSGLIISKWIGNCPWHYHTRWHVHHLIRLDYLPIWMLFSWILELLHKNNI